IDAVALAVEHKHIDKMSPAIDLVAVRRVDTAAAADDATAARQCDVQPHLVGVDGTLREQMTELQRANYRFEHIRLTRIERGYVGTKWRGQRGIDRGAAADAEQV